MPFNPDDILSDYTINSFANSLSKKDYEITKTVSTPSDGSKTITFSGNFGLGNISTDDQIRISDGTTTITYTITHPGGGDASGATDIGGGSDRDADLVVDEFVSKINASALDLTATDLGVTGDGAAFKLTPGAGKSVIITEDPNGDGNFGSSSGFTTVTDSGGGGSTTTKLEAAPFRFSKPGVPNLRGQAVNSAYETFIGLE